MSECQTITVGEADEMPSVGLGLWKIPPAEAANCVVKAIEAGYRHLDSACDYGNEASSGEGIQRALQTQVCEREQLWVTSKLWRVRNFDRSSHPKSRR